VTSKQGEDLAREKRAAWVETYTNVSANDNVGAYMLLDIIKTAQVNPLLAKVFELCLAEIEKRGPRKDADKVSSQFRIMHYIKYIQSSFS
jgi:hypothetical protein